MVRMEDFFVGVAAPARQQPSEPGSRGGVGEGLLTSVKRLSCLEAHSTRRLAATLPRRIRPGQARLG